MKSVRNCQYYIKYITYIYGPYITFGKYTMPSLMNFFKYVLGLWGQAKSVYT